MGSELSNDDVLRLLRELQGQAIPQDEVMPFEDWRQSGGPARDLSKSRGHFSAGTGMLGTSSFAPAGPASRPSGNQMTGLKGRPSLDLEPWFGNQQFGVQPSSRGSQPSQYLTQRQDQPPPWIDDVDMANVWYSPFEPVWPFGPPFYNRPREWNFPVGYNLNYIPKRIELMGMLRGMRQSWGVLSTIIETRKDQLLRLPWTIQRRGKPRGTSKGVEEIKKFFRKPDGKLTYNQWARKLLDDLLVIDAPTLYIDRQVNGKPKYLEILDGATIFPLIDDVGRRPDTTYEIGPEGLVYEHRQPAFQQIIYGLPMVNLSEDELIYAMMRPRPELPMFGYSPIEQILTEATEAIRKTFYQLEFWRSGSIPELIVTVPDNWSPKQIAMFQAHFDALLSGQLSHKGKVRFMPGGMKPFDIKNADGKSLWSDRDELLIRLVCFAYSISPTPFVKQMNRGTASTSQQTAQEEGLYPLMGFWKDDIMDLAIQEKFGADDVEFSFLPRTEVDLQKQATIHKTKIESGEMTLDEARAENGEEPYPDNLGAQPMIYTGQGAFLLKDVVAGNTPVQRGQVGQDPEDGGKGKPTSGKKPATKPADRGSSPVGGPAKPSNASTLPQTEVHTPRPTTKALIIQNLLMDALMKAGVSHKDVKQAAKEADEDPSKAQKHIGNYRKGHIRIQGLDITIENAKGSKRGEKDRHGRKWKVKMPAPYGYIKGFLGADDEHMDVYLGKHPEETMVFVIDQDKVDPDGTPKGFDEHKCFIGYRKADKALKDYLKSHFDGFGHERAVAVTAIEMPEFKRWLREGDLKKPISEQDFGQVVTRRGLRKADTISSSTGLSWYDQSATAVPKKRKKKAKGQKPTVLV